MTGFPPTDAIYFENPSLRIGGLIAFIADELHKRGARPCIDLTIGSICLPIFRSNPVFASRSLAELCERLRLEHRPGYWYRGQTSQHVCEYSGNVHKLGAAFPHLNPLTIKFENWIPSFFRSSMKDWSLYQQRPPLDQIAPAFRAVAASSNKEIRTVLANVFHSFLNELPWVAHTLGITTPGWPRGVGAPQALINFIALSQHYEYQSAMVDVTKSPDIAAWFASRRWMDDAPLKDSSSHGVIYRFDRDKINVCLQKELLTQSPASERIRQTALLGFADISEISPEFAPRPFLQEGGSLFGVENSIASLLLFAYEAVDVFTFPHKETIGDETRITNWQDLCPHQDALKEVFDLKNKPKAEKLTSAEIESFLSTEGFDGSDIRRIQFGRKYEYF